jgi:hypothetical protein
MNEQDKLRVLIPHWIEHNQEHAEEFRKWAKQADICEGEIMAAADLIHQANTSLESALHKLGGPLHHHHSALH